MSPPPPPPPPFRALAVAALPPPNAARGEGVLSLLGRGNAGIGPLCRDDFAGEGASGWKGSPGELLCAKGRVVGWPPRDSAGRWLLLSNETGVSAKFSIGLDSDARDAPLLALASSVGDWGASAGLPHNRFLIRVKATNSWADPAAIAPSPALLSGDSNFRAGRLASAADTVISSFFGPIWSLPHRPALRLQAAVPTSIDWPRLRLLARIPRVCRSASRRPCQRPPVRSVDAR